MPPNNLSTSLSTRVSTSPIGSVCLVDTRSSNMGVNVNESVHQVAVHQLGTTPSGHGSGHLKPAENSRFYPLSTIFSLISERRILGEEIALPKEYAREGWTGGQGFLL